MGTASNGKAIKDIPKGQIMTEDNFAADTATLVYRLRRMQDSLLEPEH